MADQNGTNKSLDSSKTYMHANMNFKCSPLLKLAIPQPATTLQCWLSVVEH